MYVPHVVHVFKLSKKKKQNIIYSMCVCTTILSCYCTLVVYDIIMHTCTHVATYIYSIIYTVATYVLQYLCSNALQ
jgi:hypothetical protein